MPSSFMISSLEDLHTLLSAFGQQLLEVCPDILPFLKVMMCPYHRLKCLSENIAPPLISWMTDRPMKAVSW